MEFPAHDHVIESICFANAAMLEFLIKHGKAPSPTTLEIFGVSNLFKAWTYGRVFNFPFFPLGQNVALEKRGSNKDSKMVVSSFLSEDTAKMVENEHRLVTDEECQDLDDRARITEALRSPERTDLPLSQRSGPVLFSASRDRRIKMWDAMKGICLSTLVGSEPG